MDEKTEAVVFELAASHSVLSAAEYKRDPTYNDSHFSAVAEHRFISLLNDLGLTDKFMKYLSNYSSSKGVK